MTDDDLHGPQFLLDHYGCGICHSKNVKAVLGDRYTVQPNEFSTFGTTVWVACADCNAEEDLHENAPTYEFYTDPEESVLW